MSGDYQNREYLSATEVAAYTGLAVQKIHALARTGKMAAFKSAGGQYRFRLDEIKQFRKNGGAAKTAAVKTKKAAAPHNRTLQCDAAEISRLGGRLLTLSRPARLAKIENKIICQDFFDAARYLPAAFADLLILDPPYNLSKNYNGSRFVEKEKREYAEWFERIALAARRALKPDASLYVCADWKTSMIIAPVLEKYFHIRNRITWEREKGRGAKTNWKNNIEDIWFCTVGGEYFFDVEAVKLKRKVIAPYRENGAPKDWKEESGGNFRRTHPSNIWTDISIPFWSMPENTNHPTQKPEKLFAKLILASSRPEGVVFDPFMGSGTTAAVAKKLRRRFVCAEINREYCCWGEKRLQQARPDGAIQGYADGVFWERNSYGAQMKNGGGKRADPELL